jgi:hypothetical protein
VVFHWSIRQEEVEKLFSGGREKRKIKK